MKVPRTEQKKMPAALYGENDLYSNAIKTLNPQVEQWIKTSSERAYHTARNFTGHVWFDKEWNVWREEVWKHSSPVAQYKNERLDELISEVNAGWGIL